MIIEGIDSALVARPLLVDANGQAIISAASLTTTGGKIHVDASGNLYVLPDLLTSNAHKLQLDAGDLLKVTAVTDNSNVFSGKVARITNLNLPAGQSSQMDAALPASQVWKLTWYQFVYTGTVAGVITFSTFISGGVTYYIQRHTPVVSAVRYGYGCEVVGNAGDSFGFLVAGATLNDDFTADLFYTRIK